ncbi:phycobiliprotein lyase [Calothrix sp. NIES-3974]|uniref:phycobiliprotein lyase n=1 Tax=Calothrix sp. NIES-3974 TaxID=2005462 RepID=UPI000B5E74FF|nr:phycobiliprotein lyase [Calothrix sp. NIES-3974]BAZ07916.1 hypothetical protein NIES3974_45820 [Calothrix sp. NIES-3974]
MSIQEFQAFFDCCVGKWSTERTYHYLTKREVERSHTDFVVEPITDTAKLQVLQDNQFPIPTNLEILPGYHLEFETVSETGEKVSQQLNMLFVTEGNGKIITGQYLRDRAYEEDRPIVADFQFDISKCELLMTTKYTRVVAVDSITLINPNLRIRKIITYCRPEDNQPLQEVVLVGFGVEQKA